MIAVETVVGYQHDVGFRPRELHQPAEHQIMKLICTGPTAITSSSSKLNRVGRGVVRYDRGLEAHKHTRPAPN